MQYFASTILYTGRSKSFTGKNSDTFKFPSFIADISFIVGRVPLDLANPNHDMCHAGANLVGRMHWTAKSFRLEIYRFISRTLLLAARRCTLGSRRAALIGDVY